MDWSVVEREANKMRFPFFLHFVLPLFLDSTLAELNLLS